MSRWLATLVALVVIGGLVAGGAFLVARPGSSDDVLHRLSGLEVDNATQVGTTVVLEDKEQWISLLDLESGELRTDVVRAVTHWYAGRGPVALLTRNPGLVIAFAHDGSVLWSSQDEQGQTVRPAAVFDDGATVLRVCTDQGCDLRAMELDGSERWSRPVEQGWVQRLAWFPEEIDPGRPILLPDQVVSQQDPSGADGTRETDDAVVGEPRLLDPGTGDETTLGVGVAVAGAGVVAVLDTSNGACDLTILRDADQAPAEVPGVCTDLTEPALWLIGDNAVITGNGGDQVLVATRDSTRASAPEGLLNVDATAAGLIGLDESSWLFGTNADGSMTHRVEAKWLWATGAEAMVASSERQTWNPLADGSVQHEVLDPVTGEVCGTVSVARNGGVAPLPGCRAVVTDADRGESLVVGRP